MQRLATDAVHAEKTVASLREELARLKASAQIPTQDNHAAGGSHGDVTTKAAALSVVSKDEGEVEIEVGLEDGDEGEGKGNEVVMFATV